MFTRVVSGALAALLCVVAASPAFANSPITHARASLLLDAQSGQVLYQENGLVQSYPASTTKVLTALVALEHGKLDQVMTVSAEAVDQPPDSSSCYLEAGEQQPLEYLLYGLLLVSGNDCASAIAEGVGGSEAQFVQWMNDTASRLGATHSHFANPHGLHDPNHYTTAFDLALITRSALENPTLRKIMGTQSFFWPGKSERNGEYYNHNSMLFTYEGTIGGKTGFTEEADLTLVSAATRNSRTVIGVTMGERLKEEQYADMTALMDYGLTEFDSVPAVAQGAPFGSVAVTDGKEESVPVTASGTFVVSVPKGERPQVEVQPKLTESLTAPVSAGQQVGTLQIMEDGRLLGSVPVVAQAAVAATTLTVPHLLAVSGLVLKWITLTLLALFLFRTVVKATRRMLRRSRRGYTSKRPTYGDRRATAITAYRTRGR